jgi:dihydroorotate dehydrogenase (fumarate)
LAGANAVQVVSALYKHGYPHITQMLDDVTKWMEQEGYDKIDDFRGKMSQAKSSNPAAYERVQFLKNFRHFVYQQ